MPTDPAKYDVKLVAHVTFMMTCPRWTILMLSCKCSDIQRMLMLTADIMRNSSLIVFTLVTSLVIYYLSKDLSLVDAFLVKYKTTIFRVQILLQIHYKVNGHHY